jgi:hypothetical protein
MPTKDNPPNSKNMQTLESLARELHDAYHKGTISAEEAVVKFADALGINTTTISDEHIGALADLRHHGSVLNEIVGDENVARLDSLHSKLVLAKENKLVLSGRMRVIQVERSEDRT